MGGWDALTFEVPDERVDDWIAWSGREALGVTVEPCEGGRTRLRVYFDGREAALCAARSLRVLGLEVPGPESVPDERWAERYQAGLAPFSVGRRFEIQPAGEATPAAGREGIVLVPGRAFGTGEHPTTRMCVALLEELVEPGSRWLDLGCGSAILSVVARRCGAARVLALDIDPEAVDVSRETLAANATSGVDVEEGSLPLSRPRRFDGVVCNIALGFFGAGAARLVGALAPGGLLIATGFLTGDRAEAVELVEHAGLGVVDSREEGEWLALVARAPR